MDMKKRTAQIVVGIPAIIGVALLTLAYGMGLFYTYSESTWLEKHALAENLFHFSILLVPITVSISILILLGYLKEDSEKRDRLTGILSATAVALYSPGGGWALYSGSVHIIRWLGITITEGVEGWLGIFFVLLIPLAVSSLCIFVYVNRKPSKESEPTSTKSAGDIKERKDKKKEGILSSKGAKLSLIGTLLILVGIYPTFRYLFSFPKISLICWLSGSGGLAILGIILIIVGIILDYKEKS